jgi:uncharacterized protein
MFEQSVIDTTRFARDRAHAEGVIAISECSQLSDLLFDDQGHLHFSADGFLDGKGRPGLRLTVSGELHLRCQRCLERMPFALDSARTIVLVAGADEFEQDEEEDESTDFIPLTAKLDLRALAEEEAVLALPLAPRHEESECGSTGRRDDTEQGESSPFAVLKTLKKR